MNQLNALSNRVEYYGIGWLARGDEAWLGGNKPQTGLVTEMFRCGYIQNALVDPSGDNQQPRQVLCIKTIDVILTNAKNGTDEDGFFLNAIAPT